MNVIIWINSEINDDYHSKHLHTSTTRVGGKSFDKNLFTYTHDDRIITAVEFFIRSNYAQALKML